MGGITTIGAFHRCAVWLGVMTLIVCPLAISSVAVATDEWSSDAAPDGVRMTVPALGADHQAEVDRTPVAASTDRIVHAVEVAAPRSEVWHAWTTTRGVQTFFAPAARVELRPGGPYEVYFHHDAEPGRRGSDGCKVLSYVENEMVSFTWNAPPDFPEVRGERSFVVVQLKEIDERRTLVTVTHDGFGETEQWRRVRAYFAQAWPHVIGNLKRRFEHGPLWEPIAVEPTPTRHYVYTLYPARPGFFDGPTESEVEAISGHVRHIRQLLADGRLEFAGPSDEPTQLADAGRGMVPLGIPPIGIVVFTATGDEDARHVLESDPAVAAGVFKGQVNRFTLSFRRP